MLTLSVSVTLGAGIMAVWLAAVVKLLQPHILEEVGGKRRSGGREERGFRRHSYWLHAPHLYLKTKWKMR